MLRRRHLVCIAAVLADAANLCSAPAQTPRSRRSPRRTRPPRCWRSASGRAGSGCCRCGRAAGCTHARHRPLGRSRCASAPNPTVVARIVDQPAPARAQLPSGWPNLKTDELGARQLEQRREVLKAAGAPAVLLLRGVARPDDGDPELARLGQHGRLPHTRTRRGDPRDSRQPVHPQDEAGGGVPEGESERDAALHADVFVVAESG